MRVVRILALLCTCVSISGCLSVDTPTDDIVVSVSERVATEAPIADKCDSFFLMRSMLCRKVFAEAMTNLVEQTGRNEDCLRGATICGIEEGYTNGVYTLKLDVAWSEEREEDVTMVMSAANALGRAAYVPSVDEGLDLAVWIGPKQVRDADGTNHFLGFSAMSVGRSAVISKQNVRMAELDAKSMAVLGFMGKERKMTDVKARFREVFKLRSHHPLCPDREMFSCGYEVVSLEFPKSKGDWEDGNGH